MEVNDLKKKILAGMTDDVLKQEYKAAKEDYEKSLNEENPEIDPMVHWQTMEDLSGELRNRGIDVSE